MCTLSLLGLVINPECSWFGASLDGVLHDPGCTCPNGFPEIKCPCNYHDSTPFQAASQKELCCRLEKVSVWRTTPLLLPRAWSDGYLL